MGENGRDVVRQIKWRPEEQALHTTEVNLVKKVL
jgi:hypothetical protein